VVAEVEKPQSVERAALQFSLEPFLSSGASSGGMAVPVILLTSFQRADSLILERRLPVKTDVTIEYCVV